MMPMLRLSGPLSAALIAVTTPCLARADTPIRFAEPAEVAELIGTAAVLDVRPFADYLKGHVPGAVHLDDECLRGSSKGTPAQYCAPDQLASLFGNAGVGPSETVVIYASQEDPLAATMAAYALARIGHDNIVLIAGGFESWAANHSTTKAFPEITPEPLAPAAPLLKSVTFDEISPSIGFDDTVFIDARPERQYRGDEPIWARNGHIPGAHSLDWTKLTYADNKHRLRSTAEIKAAVDALGINPADDVVVYCGTGREATLLMLALTCELQMPNVRLYEGSWTDYVTRPEIRIELGARKPPQTRVFTDGRIRISGQPNKETLRALAKDGVTTIINCRTDFEMTRVDFDEAAFAEGLGVRYIKIPMGGINGYDPAQVDALADVLRDSEGDILMHCTSGSRSRFLWMAYLVKHEGLTIDQAWARRDKLGSEPWNFEQLLGESVTIIPAKQVN